MPIVWINNAAIVAFTIETFTTIKVGYAADRVRWSYGRRKPFVAVGMLIQIVSCFFLSIRVTSDSSAILGWYTFFLMMNSFGYAVYNAPFDAWLIESSINNEDYIKIASICIPAGSVLGGVCGIGILFLSPIYAAATLVIGGTCSTYLLIQHIPNHLVRFVDDAPDLIPSVRIAARTREFQQVFNNQGSLHLFLL